MSCRKVGFSRGESACSCGAALIHATLKEITASILLRNKARIETVRQRRGTEAAPGFAAFSTWAMKFRVEPDAFRRHALALLSDASWDGHVVALDEARKRFACDTAFCGAVIEKIAQRPNKQSRTSNRLFRELTELRRSLPDIQQVYGSAD